MQQGEAAWLGLTGSWQLPRRLGSRLLLLLLLLRKVVHVGQEDRTHALGCRQKRRTPLVGRRPKPQQTLRPGWKGRSLPEGQSKAAERDESQQVGV